MAAPDSCDEGFDFNDLSQHAPADPDSNNGDGHAAPPPKAKRIACILCRKRKLKCDGQRPSCGTCKRLAHDCAYDEVRKKSGPKRGYVKALEARLQQVETLLKTQESTEQSQPQRSNSNAFPTDPSTQRSDLQGSNIILDNMAQVMESVFPPGNGISPGEFPAMQTGTADNSSSSDPFSWEMIGLGLDEPLPNQEVINELNQLYFEKFNVVVPMIHRPRFLAAMNLAPHMRPPICLRYIMWTLAASSSDKYSSLQEHFYHRARKYIQMDEMKGHGESMLTLAHCQSWALISSYEFKSMYFPRAWISAGRAVRMAQMMNLHKLDGAGLDVKQCLPPPKDWTEREERRRTFWMCFNVDRYASIGTGWPMTMDERDIATNLPTVDEAFETSKPEGSISLEQALQPGGASKLTPFGGVCVMAAMFGRNLLHLHRPTNDEREEDLNGEFWERHRRLDNLLLSMALSLPEDMRLPRGINQPNTVFMNMKIHTSIICLHQAAIFKADKNRMPAYISQESKIRCITAATEIAGIMRLIAHIDTTNMNPFISFCVYVAARVFVQYLKNRPGDGQMNNHLQFLLQAMQALKRKNPLTESFLVQLDLDLEGAGILSPFGGKGHSHGKMNKRQSQGYGGDVSSSNMANVSSTSSGSFNFGQLPTTGDEFDNLFYSSTSGVAEWDMSGGTGMTGLTPLPESAWTQMLDNGWEGFGPGHGTDVFGNRLNEPRNRQR
ncbi:C6 transcription factor [Neofusicoccum parvum]|nr:C6 transcription factor [Neofusicoccum parvum]